MLLVRINDVIKDSVLVSRDSARLLERKITELMAQAAVSADDAPSQLAVDFQGVAGIAPSFMDELITIFERFVRQQHPSTCRQIQLLNAPVRLSSKFEAVARGHGMVIRTMPDRSWQLADIGFGDATASG